MSDLRLERVDRKTILRAEQVRFLYRTPVAMIVNLVNAAIVAAVLWRVYPTGPLVLWLALFFLVIPARLLVWRRYRRSQPPAEQAELWARRFVVGIFLTGCLWGLCGSVVLATPDLTYQVFVAFVLGGMCAGAVAATAAYLPALAAFVTPTAAPIIVAFLTRGTLLAISMGALSAVFVAALIAMGYGFNRTLNETFRLQAENAALIRRLTAARNVADAASQAKSRFLRQMSHELRTPLNAIIGFSEMFTAEHFGKLPSPEYLAYSRLISESAHQLLARIKQILDVSKAEPGAADLTETEVELRPLIEACVQEATGGIHAGRHGVTVTISPLPPRLYADAGKLRQILDNLLANVVKFTPKGGRIEVAAETDAEGAVLISVADSGIGMRPEDIPRAFSPFIQLDDALSRRYEGAGIGLTLAKEFAELHGASIDVESAPGRGTRVTLRFPRERTRQDAPAPAQTIKT